MNRTPGLPLRRGSLYDDFTRELSYPLSLYYRSTTHVRYARGSTDSHEGALSISVYGVQPAPMWVAAARLRRSLNLGWVGFHPQPISTNVAKMIGRQGLAERWNRNLRTVDRRVRQPGFPMPLRLSGLSGSPEWIEKEVEEWELKQRTPLEATARGHPLCQRQVRQRCCSDV